jgi:amino acid transporter
MFSHDGDIESSPVSAQHDFDNNPILKPQLNVGGHGARQRRLQNCHIAMMVSALV